MAKKKTTKKKSAGKKKTAKKKAAGKSSAGKKKTAKKKVAAKTKSAAKKKTAKKKAAPKKKAAAKKAAPKKTSSQKKAESKKTAGKKKAAKTTAKKTNSAAKSANKSKTTSKKKSAAKAEDAPKPKLKLSLAQPGALNLKTKSKQRVKTVKPPETSVPVLERAEAPSEAALRRVKTDLTRADKNRYRNLLMAKRQELLGDVEALQTESKSSGGDLSHMPVHMADAGTDQYEHEFTLGLVESERKLLKEINDALLRIKSGTYGVCLETGEPINKDRLDAKPWAKYSIEVVRERERRGQE